METSIDHSSIVIVEQNIASIKLASLHKSLVDMRTYTMGVMRYLCEQLSVFLIQEWEGRFEALGHQAQLQRMTTITTCTLRVQEDTCSRSACKAVRQEGLV